MDSSHETASYKPENLQALMTEKVEAAGGKMRFDAYMREHLFGREGYYTKRVEIGDTHYFGHGSEGIMPPGHFDTDASDKAFPLLLQLHFVAQGITGKDFLELGGGNGSFKRNYLSTRPDTNYISVDSSPKLAVLQQTEGGHTILGSALNLPLRDGCIDGVVFSNELLDALPCRVLKLASSVEGVRVDQEAYVVSGTDGLEFVYQPVKRDEFIIDYEKYLAARHYDAEDGRVDSVSPLILRAFQEAARVLKPGGRAIFFDYGISRKYVHMKRDAEEFPYYYFRGFRGDIEGMLTAPYKTDITYSVDFDYCGWLANRILPNAEVDYSPMHHLFRGVMENNPQLNIQPSELVKPRGMGYIELAK